MINYSLLVSLCEELNNELAGGCIEKVQQPAKDIIILTVRNNRKNYPLIISAGSGKARIHITESAYENPKEAPMFCMLMRKHLTGGRISSFELLNEDKIISISLVCHDDFGRLSNKYLIAEMTGRCPNIVLCDDSWHIIECIHRRDFRNPGLIYRFPIKPSFEEKNVEFEGSPSKYLDDFYTEKERADVLKSKSKELRTLLNNLIKRTEKKIGNRKIELSKTENRDEIRHKADLITSNIYRIKKGDKLLVCEDFYNNCEEIIIELDENKTPQQYCAKLYKEYIKLKTAEIYLKNLIEEAENQLEFLLSEQDLLVRAEKEADIDAIRDELFKQGFLKQSKKKNDKKCLKCTYNEQTSPNGKRILIGKNNTQNEEITFKIASKSDYWFHAKDFHGSHVVLLCDGEIPADEDIKTAAEYAAINSQANGNCFVDYCEIRFVKKQKPYFPGRVNYSDYTSIKIKV